MAVQTAKAGTQSAGQPKPQREVNIGGLTLPYMLVFPTLLLIVVIAVYPILNSIYLSFIDNPLLQSGSKFVGLNNYAKILSDPVFRSAISNTVIFTIASVVLETILGLGVALLINKTFPGRGLVRAAILVPWAFPTVVSAQMWLLMYNDQTGIITYILQGLHLLAPGAALTESTTGVLTAAIITDVWKTTPFMALLILAGLQLISADLYEAASVDGSTRWQQFWSITLPMLKSSILIALLFRALDAIRAFDVFYVFGGNAVQSMGTYANFKLFGSTNIVFSQGVAAAIVVFIFGLVISLIIVPLMRDTLRA